jgi:hypothetical protein
MAQTAPPSPGHSYVNEPRFRRGAADLSRPMSGSPSRRNYAHVMVLTMLIVIFTTSDVMHIAYLALDISCRGWTHTSCICAFLRHFCFCCCMCWLYLYSSSIYGLLFVPAGSAFMRARIFMSWICCCSFVGVCFRRCHELVCESKWIVWR